MNNRKPNKSVKKNFAKGSDPLPYLLLNQVDSVKEKRIFSSEQLDKREERAEGKLDKLIDDIVTAKEGNNQKHFNFPAAVIGGLVGTNFILLQGGTPTDQVLKYALIFGGAGILFKINKHFGNRTRVFKNMLKQANVVAKEFRKGDVELENIPSFHRLHKAVSISTLGEKEAKKQFNNRASADLAVYLVVGITLISLADDLANYLYRDELQNKAVENSEDSISKKEPSRKPRSPSF